MKSRKNQFLIYRWANIAVGIICLGLLLLGKSEPQNQLIFGYSLRIILLAVLMLAFTVGFFIVTQPRANLFRKEELKPVDARLPAPETRLKHGWVWLAILALAGLGAFLALLFIHFSHDSQFRAPLMRVLPFVAFWLYFPISTIIYLETSRFTCNFKYLIDIILTSFRNPLEFTLFELTYLAAASTIFTRLITSIRGMEDILGNQFLSNVVWSFTIISGLFVFYIVRNVQIGNVLEDLHIKDGYVYAVFALMALLILSIGHPIFGANDDYAMMSIASGQIDGVPDAHLVYTNVLIGMILNFLYSFSDKINWYSIYLLGVLVVSSFVLLKCILDIFKGTKIKWIALVIFFVFIPRFIYTYNYTTIAMVAAFTGIALLVKSTFPGQASTSRFEYFLGIALIIIAGMMRFNALGLVGLFIAPAILFLILKEHRFNLILPFGVSLALFLGAYFYDIQSYKASSEWSTFINYNTPREQIQGTPKWVYNPSQLSFWNQIGWQKSGYDLFVNFLYVDNQVFTLEKMNLVNQEFRTAVNSPALVVQRLLEIFNRFQVEEISFFVTLTVVFLNLHFRTNRFRIYIGFLTVYLVGILIWLAFTQRIPDHLVLPSLFIFSLFLLAIGQYFTDTKTIIEKRSIPFSYLPIVLVGMILLQTLTFIQLDQVNTLRFKTRTSLFDAVSNSVRDSNEVLVVFQASTVPESWVPPFAAVEIPFDYLPTGWLIYTPPYNHLLKQHGIDNLMDASYSSPNVYFLGDVEELMINYLKNVKHIDVRLEKSQAFYYSDRLNSDNFYKIELIRIAKISEENDS